MSALDFKRLPDAQQPIAGLFWEPSCPILHVIEKTGRELVMDIPPNSVRGCKYWAELKDVEQFEPSSCGRYIAIVRAGKAAVWNLHKDRIVAAPVNPENIDRVAWRPNPPCSAGELWLMGPSGVRVWSAEGYFTSAVQKPGAFGGALGWDPAGAYLASVCASGHPQVWNTRTNESIALQGTGEHAIRELAWNSRGAMLAGVSTNSLFVWNVPAALHGGTSAAVIRCLKSAVSRLSFRPGGNVIAVGAIHGELVLCRASRLDETTGSAALDGAITHLAWSGNGKHLAVALCSGQVYVAKVCR